MVVGSNSVSLMHFGLGLGLSGLVSEAYKVDSTTCASLCSWKMVIDSTNLALFGLSLVTWIYSGLI